MKHNVISLNLYVQQLVNAGAGIYRLSGIVEFVKLPRKIALEKEGQVSELEAGAFVSIDGNCETCQSPLMTFVGRKQVVGYV